LFLRVERDRAARAIDRVRSTIAPAARSRPETVSKKEDSMFRHVIPISIACACLAFAASQGTNVQRELSRLNVPEKLVPKGEQALLMARGEGVQIYVAEEKDGKLAWKLEAPRADLLDYATGAKIGTHSAGPIWTDEDGSKLTGKKLESADSPNADAVPWLLLETKAEGSGRFAHVRHVQRVDTWGGRAPAAAPAKASETREVRYEATYVFLGDR
jgi:hypothetical protein